MNYEKEPYLAVWRRLEDIATMDDDSTLPDIPDSKLPELIYGDCWIGIDDEAAALSSGLFTRRDFEAGVKFSTIYKRHLRAAGTISLAFVVPSEKAAAVRMAVAAILAEPKPTLTA